VDQHVDLMGGWKLAPQKLLEFRAATRRADKMTGMVLYTGVPIQVEPVTA